MPCAAINKASCLSGERFSYQVAVIGFSEYTFSEYIDIQVESDLPVKIYEVGYVPVVKPSYHNEYDNRYITHQPAILPDIIMETDNVITISGDKYSILWVSIDTSEKSGVHEIKIKFKNEGKFCGESIFKLEVISVSLPEQKFIFTEWMHCDCISSYYGLSPLGEKHWEYIEKYMQMATENGVNMMLTPIFTPPLDTKIGHERPTVQLIDISYNDGEYNFDFKNLLRWIDVCKRVNVTYLEIAHLFTQWGAMHAPKIEVWEDAKKIKKFGWETDSESSEYLDFLNQLLPQLTEFLSKYWDKSRVYFHISDEPGIEHSERYERLFSFVKERIEGFQLMDAISDYEFCEKGFSATPICTIKTIDKFIEHNAKNLWGYYCCGEGSGNLSNRFIAMPSYRNRIIGIQLYKYGIKGFLHWGYNFYYSQYSVKSINPFITNDAYGGFPAGDSFSVYPGFDGPIPSIRLFVFFEALQDMRALQLLETLIGRRNVVKIIDELAGTDMTFTDYPCGVEFIHNLREKVNETIKKSAYSDVVNF